jgi:hypothetical protein
MFHNAAASTKERYSVFTYLPLLPRVFGPPIFVLSVIGFIACLRGRFRLLALCAAVQFVALTGAIILPADHDPQLRYWVPVAPIVGLLAICGLETICGGSPKQHASELQGWSRLFSPRVVAVAAAGFSMALILVLYLRGTYLIYRFELLLTVTMCIAVLVTISAKKNPSLRWAAFVIFLTFSSSMYFFWWVRPVRLQPALQPSVNSASWVQKQGPLPVISNDPFFWIAYGHDPWVESPLFGFTYQFDRAARDLPVGGLAIWNMREYLSGKVPKFDHIQSFGKFDLLQTFTCPEPKSHCDVYILQKRSQSTNEQDRESRSNAPTFDVK